MQRMPISLLELNTFGHALCAVLIYLLWWEKPFEVDCPTIIQSESLWDFRALNSMRKSPSDVAQSVNRELRALVKDDKRFQVLQKSGRNNKLHTHVRLPPFILCQFYSCAPLQLIVSLLSDNDSKSEHPI